MTLPSCDSDGQNSEPLVCRVTGRAVAAPAALIGGPRLFDAAVCGHLGEGGDAGVGQAAGRAEEGVSGVAGRAVHGVAGGVERLPFGLAAPGRDEEDVVVAV